MRWTPYFFFIAPPRALAASISSSASLSVIVLPERVRAYSSSQRMARDCRRNLIVCTAHAPRLYFQDRLDVLDGLLERRQRIAIGFLADLVHGAVENPLRRRAFSVPHHRIDELLHQIAAVHRIGRDLAPWNESFTWHAFLLLVSLLLRFLATSARPWAAWRRISSAPACGSQRRRRRAS